MNVDRPMSEYEGALFDALVVISKTMADGACDRRTLAARYREIARWETEAGRPNGAATMDLLARLTEEDRRYSARPPLTVIDGGKTSEP